jgi:hypothetical protein
MRVAQCTGVAIGYDHRLFARSIQMVYSALALANARSTSGLKKREAQLRLSSAVTRAPLCSSQLQSGEQAWLRRIRINSRARLRKHRRIRGDRIHRSISAVRNARTAQTAVVRFWSPRGAARGADQTCYMAVPSRADTCAVHSPQTLDRPHTMRMRHQYNSLDKEPRDDPDYPGGLVCESWLLHVFV